MRVCRQTILNIFDLEGWNVNNWLNKEEKIENKNDNMDHDESVDEERMENTSHEKQKKTVDLQDKNSAWLNTIA